MITSRAKPYSVLISIIISITGTAVHSESQGTNPCECAASKICWTLLLSSYRNNTISARTEIEEAPKNRFFPDSDASALLKSDAHGNFLSVRCGPKRTVCNAERDELQKRVIYTSFLAALPRKGSTDALFNPKNWAVTGEGENLIAKTRECKPDLFLELVEAMGK